MARVEYLIALEEGREVREETTAKPKAPMDLLAEMLEVQEALEEAKSGGLTEETTGRLRSERQRLEDRRRAEEAALIAARDRVGRGRGRRSGPRSRCSGASSSAWPPAPTSAP